jgi:serine/threonine-protein kinase
MSRRRTVRPSRTIDIKGHAVNRLGFAAAGVWVVMFVLMVTGYRLGDSVRPTALSRGVELAGLVSSLGVFIVCQLTRLRARRVLDIGLIWVVIVAFTAAFHENLAPWTAGTTMRGVSIVCVWALLVPVLIPTSLAKIIATELAIAAMSPTAIAIATLTLDYPQPPTEVVLVQSVPNALAAGIGVLVWRLLRARRDVETKRELLGSYTLEEKLGEGGMGEVWRAKHRLLIRPAAVKIIPPKQLDGMSEDRRTMFIKRFQREARATSALRSPHTIALYDFGVNDDGTLYYAMELLDGIDLQKLVVKHGPIPAERAMHFLLQASHSLAEAHSVGLVHRDIKPSNLFVCRRGLDVDVLKVLDFGLVRMEETTDSSDRLTAENRTIGSPAYMAPEAMVSARDADARADIYSIACVGYWLLTGKQVFSGSNPMKVAAQHLSEPPPRPSERTKLVIPNDLDDLLLSCLAKQPDERVQTAAELAAALRAIDIEFPWDDDRAQRWWEVHL